MGKYKFRLSDMIPNAWFYKLKDMSKPTKKNNQPYQPPSTFASSTKPTSPPKPKQQVMIHHSRKSYYFTRELKNSSKFEPPRKSCSQKQKKKKKKKSLDSKLAMSTSSSVSAGCRASIEFVFTKSDEHLSSTTSSSIESFSETLELQCDHVLATEKDIIIDVDNSPSEKNKKIKNQLDSSTFSVLDLPRIITKPERSFDEVASDVKKSNTYKTNNKRRVSTTSTSPGVKLRINSPRIGSQKLNLQTRRRRTTSTLSDSFAIVKSSFDPQRDFRESMVEMILENNIKASKDLEDLLACYLSLNADEYHELIIKVFKQIWFDLTDIQSKVKIKV